jgi:HK97 family phage major capsid protein
MLTLDPVKLAACKTEDEKFLLGLETLKAELEKDATARDNAGLAILKKQVEDAAKAFEQRMAERFPQFSLPGVEYDKDGTKAKKAFSLARAAHAVKKDVWTGAGYEKEVFDAAEQAGFHTKAMSAGVDTSGGFFVPNQISATLIEKLLPQVIAFQLGVNQIDMGSVGSLTFNRELTTPTATWVGEMITAAKSQGTFGQYTVSPKAVSAKVDISNLLIMLANGATGAEQRFVNAAVRQFRLAYDKAIIIGASSQQGPVGIVNTPGVQTSSSASITFNKLVAFVSALRNSDALVGNKLGWAMTPAQLQAIETMIDSSSPNQQLVRRAVDQGTLDRLRGYPFATTTQMGTTGINTLIFGAWDMATFFSWFGGFLMKRSDTSDNALDNDLTRIVLRGYGDVGVDQPTAFCVASD